MRLIVGRLIELMSSIGTDGNAVTSTDAADVEALYGLITKFCMKEAV